ncbi:mitochondrial respiratory chain complex III assembly protein, LYR family Mzm1 [Schizosaccharomyces pombe]|uniref:Mitochondrial zinc maintenance protein 1, mitochondrial n=1 Tax=Schizosaccharomyces pombe (strain 972 / ATCC 24843) TaxID=284812 RepID=MZM1_SCHPO|nr:protein new18 [Schizosaccharomyces pombe]G2TRP8.1 RecName: Full=Mitochondrial zinc maintenance protein 1, mitochondrial; Flags: Precursor [Schizosaccharomyces pombe 972h-]CCD31377.1 mitochondrial protein [Schizosaccharomyces pombe]|eukprot:NP_001343167.1 protein new18 [Schizosaccharomyces pombe]
MSAAKQCFRNLWRASNSVFEGDPMILAAARDKIRTGFHNHRCCSPEEAKKEIQNGNAVAEILRRNVVQAEKQSNDTYSLKIRKTTEINTNRQFTEKKFPR